MKNIIITGASSGIGFATAKLCAERGIDTMMIGTRDGKECLEEVKSVAKDGAKVVYCRCNLTVLEDVKKMVELAVREFGSIDAFVNCAGVFAKGRLHETSEEDWDNVFNVDIKALWVTSKYVIPQMIQQGCGSVVNVASVCGMAGGYNMAAYNAAKGAVINLTRAMALDYGADGIRTNAVCPGATKTPMFRKNPQEVIDLFENQNPMKRIAHPEDVAKMIYFAASDESSFTNGAVLTVTGGVEVYTGEPVQL